MCVLAASLIFTVLQAVAVVVSLLKGCAVLAVHDTP